MFDVFFRYGITVIGISSDGDNRLVSAMKELTSFDLNQITTAQPNLKPNYIQDTIHIGTKLRNRMLNSSIVLYMGNKVVSVVHIKSLLELVPKEIHGLVHSDILPEDRQNYRSLEKIMEDRVLNEMNMNVADCEGTVMYLKLCRLITSSLNAPNLKPIERIYNIWYAVFFLRCWRKYIQSSDEYSLNENFISNNSYTCVEINAHNLIEIVRRLRFTGEENLFLTKFFASQPCENIFRMMRSMGTINFTKINFWLNELLHMIARVELMNKTIYTCKEIDFPRISKERSSNILQTLPSDDEIKQTIGSAQTSALQDAVRFGMIFDANDIANFQKPQMKSPSLKTSFESENEDDSDDQTTDKQVLEESKSEEKVSRFLVFIDPDGTTRNVLKSTFIWEQIKVKDKLSSDRLRRVQGSSRSIIGAGAKHPAKRQKKSTLGAPEASSEEGDPTSKENIVKSDEIMIGDWVIFDLTNETIPSDLEDEIAKQNGHLIGLVIGFRIKDENNRTLQYKTDFVSLSSQNQGRKKIVVLAIWYSCNEEGLLNQINRNLSIGIESYKRTMKAPATIPAIKSGSNSVSYILSFQYSELQNLHMVSS